MGCSMYISSFSNISKQLIKQCFTRGVNLLNEYNSTIQLHMLTHNGEYESVDAVLFGSSSLVFEFHLIYVNLCQTINKTTTIDLRGI